MRTAADVDKTMVESVLEIFFLSVIHLRPALSTDIAFCLLASLSSLIEVFPALC